MRTRTRTHAHIHTRTSTRAHTRTHAHTHATHAHTRTLWHARTHAHTRARAHTHTHAMQQIFRCIWSKGIFSLMCSWNVLSDWQEIIILIVQTISWPNFEKSEIGSTYTKNLTWEVKIIIACPYLADILAISCSGGPRPRGYLCKSLENGRALWLSFLLGNKQGVKKAKCFADAYTTSWNPYAGHMYLESLSKLTWSRFSFLRILDEIKPNTVWSCGAGPDLQARSF